jgi:hypothetical protein
VGAQSPTTNAKIFGDREPIERNAWIQLLRRAPFTARHQDRNRDRMNAVKQLAVVVLSLLVVTAWLTAILYFSLMMEF